MICSAPKSNYIRKVYADAILAKLLGGWVLGWEGWGVWVGRWVGVDGRMNGCMDA